MASSALAPGTLVPVNCLTVTADISLNGKFEIVRGDAAADALLAVEITAKEGADFRVADIKPPISIKLSDLDVFDPIRGGRFGYRILEAYLTKKAYTMLMNEGRSERMYEPWAEMLTIPGFSPALEQKGETAGMMQMAGKFEKAIDMGKEYLLEMPQ